MNALVNATSTTQVTMTSLELVDFINSQRKPCEAILRHDSFMAKVPKVLGENNAQKLLDIYFDVRGREQRCYVFPKREACLMAMSYSYEIQAVVFDRMTALENQLIKPVITLPDFNDPAEAAIAWATQYKATQLAITERDHAIATKAQISDKKTATAMATASSAVRTANKLKQQLGRCVDYACVLAVQSATKNKYQWQPLKAYCKANDLPPIKVHHEAYGFVNSYPAAAWLAAYGVDVQALFGEAA